MSRDDGYDEELGSMPDTDFYARTSGPERTDMRDSITRADVHAAFAALGIKDVGDILSVHIDGAGLEITRRYIHDAATQTGLADSGGRPVVSVEHLAITEAASPHRTGTLPGPPRV